MFRDTELYLLFDKDWKPLAELINRSVDIYLQSDITIYQLFNATSISQAYAILTRTEKADKLVESYGCLKASENDTLRTTLHDYYGEPIFGSKNNVIHLKKLS